MRQRKSVWICGSVFVVLLCVLLNTCRADSYCTASGGCQEFIDSFHFYLNNNSGTGCFLGYDDRTIGAIDIQPGQSYQVLVVNGSPYSGDQCRIWIDWNQDYVFGTGDEEIFLDGGPDYFYNTIVVPADAPYGQTRFRARLNYTGTMSPCGTTQYGEVEDYTVNVVPPGQTEVIFESATIGPMNQDSGYLFDEVTWLGVRFELTQTTQITAVGAHICDISTEQHPVVAFFVVELDNENDFPNYNALPAWGLTVATPPQASMDFRVHMSTPQLDPGWYALIIGYDDYFTGSGIMPTDGQSPVGSPSFIVRTEEDWYDAYMIGTPRFVVEGTTVASCGEPNTPINPVPWNGLEGVSLNPQLHWTEENNWPCETTYDVYLDANNPPTTLLASDLNESNYGCSGLEPNTTYFWKVAAKTDSGQKSGPVWSFQTDDLSELPELPRYYIIDLGVIEEVYYGDIPLSSSMAYALNEQGHVVGNTRKTSMAYRDYTFFWRDANGNRQSDPNEMIRAEDIKEYGYNYAYDISNNGLVVGVVGEDALNNGAFKWLDENGNYEVDPGEADYLPAPPVPPLYLYASSMAFGCNDNLMAVGKCDVNDDGTKRVRACVWDTSAGTYTVLGTLGGTDSRAAAISDSNVVVGQAFCDDSNEHGFIWVDGDADGGWQESEMIEVPTFGGDDSTSLDINKNGHVVGRAEDANGKSYAYIWIDSNGNGQCERDEMTNIATIDNCLGSEARALNDYDQVVGRVQYYTGSYFGLSAFYWDKNTGMVDLFDLVCNKEDWDYLMLAEDISNNGWIVGQGRKLNGGYHAFLMVPEVDRGDINCDSSVNLADYAEMASQWQLSGKNTDIYPGGGDGITNLVEYAVLARAWKSTSPSWPYNGMVDFNHDNTIDVNDLTVLLDGYMKPGCYNADIAPLPVGDGTVNLEDLAVIAEQWLTDGL